MLSLEKAPQASADFLNTLNRNSVGLEIPDGSFLPPRLRGHPAVDLPYDVISSTDLELAAGLEYPVWGGMVSEESFEGSAFMISDNMDEDVRRAAGAIFSLLNYGEHPSVIRSVLIELNRSDAELGLALGRMLYANAASFEPMYRGKSRKLREKFEQDTGFPMVGHQETVRAIGGEVLFSGNVVSGFRDSVLSGGVLLSERLDAEIPVSTGLASQQTVYLGKPHGLNPAHRVTNAVVNIEPSFPRKPHVCAGCHLHIAPKAMRVTVGVEANGSKYDHHHYHAGCAD